MTSSIEFITGRDASLETLAVIQNAAPVGIETGLRVEINYGDYVVGQINVIVSHTQSHIVYQVHVARVP